MKHFVTQIFNQRSTCFSSSVLCKTLHSFGNISSLKSIGFDLTKSTRNYAVICPRIKSNQSIYRSANRSFIRGFSKNNQIKEILYRRQLVDFNNFHKARFLLKAQSVLDNPRASGSGAGGSATYRRVWNEDMVKVMEKLKLTEEMPWDSEVDAVLKALKKKEESIIEYFRSLNTHETIFTNRKRILLYSDDMIEAEADESSALLQKAWQKIEQQKNRKIIMPEQNSYADNILSKVTTIHTKFKDSSPGEISKRLDQWKVVILDEPTIWQAAAMANGHIYVSKSLIDWASDTQMAFVLAHEMSHTYLKHSNEQASLRDFYMGFSWTTICNVHKAARYWEDEAKALEMKRFQDVLFKEFPTKTCHEAEADHMGLHLSSKAGFDQTQSGKFFEMISQTVPDAHRKNFYEIEEIQKDMNTTYRCPSEPEDEDKHPWMDYYVERMEKWEKDHPALPDRTASLKTLIEKMVHGEGEADDEESKLKKKG